MKRAKGIFGSAVFIAIGLALAIMASYVLRPTDDSFYRSKIAGFYEEERNSLDIIGFGSSALYRYVNSPLLYDLTGITSYMYATPGQSIYAIEHMIDETSKTQTPKLLIIETRKFVRVSARQVKENRFRLITDNMNYSWNRFSLINSLIEGWDERLPYYFDIMLYHENWENLTADNFRYFDNKEPIPSKSWFNIDRNKPIIRPELDQVTEEVPIAEEPQKTLYSLMEKCKEKNVDVLFVATPWQIGEEHEKENNWLKRVVEENGFQFLDANRYYDEIGLDFDVDFYNENHTNTIGAKKFTEFIAEYIMEHYDLKPDYSDEVIKSWEKAARQDREDYIENEAEILRIVEERHNEENEEG